MEKDGEEMSKEQVKRGDGLLKNKKIA